MRGYVWQTLANIEQYRIPGKYDELKKLPVDNTDKVIMEIYEDLHRTNPLSTFLKDEFGLGLSRLFNVLRCFSKYYCSTSYVQGMSYIAANLISYMEEESAFWMLYSLMENYNLKNLYKPNFPGMNKIYYKLLYFLKKNCEKVYNHLKNAEITPLTYSLERFLTLFFNNNSITDLVLRIFDSFLLEKEKTLHKFMIALFKINEEKIISASRFDDTMLVLNQMDSNINKETWINFAFSINITDETFKDLENKYNENKGNKNDEFIEFLMR